MERLKALFALFSATLERLDQLDSGHQNHLKRGGS